MGIIIHIRRSYLGYEKMIACFFLPVSTRMSRAVQFISTSNPINVPSAPGTASVGGRFIFKTHCVAVWSYLSDLVTQGGVGWRVGGGQGTALD